MNFRIGSLASVKDAYVSDDELQVGLVIDVGYARDHKIKAVRDVASVIENQELQIIRLSFGDGRVSEYFDDELEEIKSV